VKDKRHAKSKVKRLVQFPAMEAKKTGQPIKIALPNLTLNYVQINALALYVSCWPKP
jgi:hypothetical protein